MRLFLFHLIVCQVIMSKVTANSCMSKLVQSVRLFNLVRSRKHMCMRYADSEFAVRATREDDSKDISFVVTENHGSPYAAVLRINVFFGCC